jgi:ElaB/YqjD/DUF883 family membrane-anchored ribosome-binding protein
MESRLQNPVISTEHTAKNELVPRSEKLKAMIRRSQERTVEKAKAADKVIRSHPYQSIGATFFVALGLGAAIGYFVRRSR